MPKGNDVDSFSVWQINCVQYRIHNMLIVFLYNPDEIAAETKGLQLFSECCFSFAFFYLCYCLGVPTDMTLLLFH